MFVYAPVQYHLLMEYSRSAGKLDSGRNLKHTAIEAVALNSDNPAFKTVRFRKALIAYRRTGLHPLRKTQWTLRDAVYFSKHSYKVHRAIKQCTE